jgi:hypothetical protein
MRIFSASLSLSEMFRGKLHEDLLVRWLAAIHNPSRRMLLFAALPLLTIEAKKKNSRDG